jgi:pimeloyl-ACP methyl ester carboxylesterase
MPLKPGETTPWLDLVRQKKKDAKVEIVAGVGHFTQLEAPDTVNRLIRDFALSL